MDLGDESLIMTQCYADTQAPTGMRSTEGKESDDTISLTQCYSSQVVADACTRIDEAKERATIDEDEPPMTQVYYGIGLDGPCDSIPIPGCAELSTKSCSRGSGAAGRLGGVTLAKFGAPVGSSAALGIPLGSSIFPAGIAPSQNCSSNIASRSCEGIGPYDDSMDLMLTQVYTGPSFSTDSKSRKTGDATIAKEQPFASATNCSGAMTAEAESTVVQHELANESPSLTQCYLQAANDDDDNDIMATQVYAPTEGAEKAAAAQEHATRGSQSVQQLFEGYTGRIHYVPEDSDDDLTPAPVVANGRSGGSRSKGRGRRSGSSGATVGGVSGSRQSTAKAATRTAMAAVPQAPLMGAPTAAARSSKTGEQRGRAAAASAGTRVAQNQRASKAGIAKAEVARAEAHKARRPRARAGDATEPRPPCAEAKRPREPKPRCRKSSTDMQPSRKRGAIVKHAAAPKQENAGGLAQSAPVNTPPRRAPPEFVWTPPRRLRGKQPPPSSAVIGSAEKTAIREASSSFGAIVVPPKMIQVDLKAVRSAQTYRCTDSGSTAATSIDPKVAAASCTVQATVVSAEAHVLPTLPLK